MAQTPYDGIDFQHSHSLNTHSEPSSVISIDGQSHIGLPSSDYITDSEILRDGQDLILQLSDGSQLIIENYFNSATQPHLIFEGQSLSPELVESFVQFIGPTQYAQSSVLDDESPIGLIEEMSGTATVTRIDGTVEALEIDSEIFMGDIIETEGDGAVNILFIDSSTFAISENAKLAIDEFVYNSNSEQGETNFSVLKGVFVYTSGLIAQDDPDDVKIDTPMGSIGIRGTTILGDIDDGVITVIEGAIVLIDFNGNYTTLDNEFDTARFDSSSSEFVYEGQSSPSDLNNNYASLNPVAPHVFTSVEDAIQLENLIMAETEDPGPSTDDPAAQEPVELAEAPQEPVPGEEPVLLKEPLPGEPLPGEELALADGGTLEPLEPPPGEEPTLLKEPLPGEPLPGEDITLADGGTLEPLEPLPGQEPPQEPLPGEPLPGEDITLADGGTLEPLEPLPGQEPTQEPLPGEDITLADAGISEPIDPALEPVPTTTSTEEPIILASTTTTSFDGSSTTSFDGSGTTSFDGGSTTTSESPPPPPPDSGSTSTSSGSTTTTNPDGTGDTTTTEPPPLPPPPLNLIINRQVADDDLQIGDVVAIIDNSAGITDIFYSLNGVLINGSPASPGDFSLVNIAGGRAAIIREAGTWNSGDLFGFSITANSPTGASTTQNFGVLVQDLLQITNIVAVDSTGDTTFQVDEGSTGPAINMTAIIALDEAPGAQVVNWTLVNARSASNIDVSSAITIDDGFGAANQAQLQLSSALDHAASGGFIVVTVEGSTIDDDGQTITFVRNFNIAINDISNALPTVDLDGDNSSGAIDPDYNTTWNEGAAVNITDNDTIINDPDNANLQSMTITITNPQDGTNEFIFLNGAASAAAAGASLSVVGDMTHSITISGLGSIADYQAVLEGILWDNSLDVPNTATRTIDVVINDGTSSSVAATSHITINAINDNDTLTGTAGADTINGDAGNDTINALAGNDTVNGGDGNDIINGGQGADFLQGGNGDDSFIISFNDGIDNIVGGAGSDTYDASAITANITIDVSSFAGSTLVDIGTDTNETVSGVENFILGSGNNILNMLLASTASNFLFNGTAGTDTIDYSAYNANSINSNLGANDVNVVGGGVHTIQGFENIIGTQLNDTIIGSAVGNVISGGLGNDNLSGGAGNDVLNGSTGDDTLAGGTGDDTLDGDLGIDVASYVSSTTAVSVNLALGTATGEGNDTLSNIENISGSSFNDTLIGDTNNNVLRGNSGDDNINGGAGDDFLLGGLGNDALDGGAGIDTADYSAIKTAVTVDLNIGTASGEGNDTLTNIENINGSAFGDTLSGDANNNLINGGDGNDNLSGNLGDDTLDGGNGIDTANYGASTTGVTVDLSTGTASGEGNDTLLSIENISGSGFNDTLNGDNNNNTILGGNGDDTLNGRGGNDTLDGGNGFDTVDYSSSTVSVNVDLGAGTASGNGNDTLISIENILGSAQNDVLSGDANSNDISGGDGNDQINGRGGIDTINGGNGDDVIAGDGNDTLNGGAGIDTLDYFSLGVGVTVDLSIDSSSTGDSISNFENVNGTSSNDDLTGDAGDNVLSGNAGDDVLSGGLGNDTLDGGTGIDVADFSGVSTGGITVDLSAGTASGEGNDTLISIENVIGSIFNDTIIGDANNNVFFNSDGLDTLDGGAGNDLLYYDGAISPITIDNGSNYSITAIEHLDFQTNGTSENITITVQDSMVFNNAGNFLLIEIDDLDSFSIDFSTNTSGWNFNGSGVNWQEYEKSGMIIRIESITDTSNIAVTGAEGLPVSLNDILSGANTTDGFGYQETSADRGYGGIIASLGGDAGISGEGDDFVVFAEDPLDQQIMIGTDGVFSPTGAGASLSGADLSRKSVSGAGDFNGDGNLDIILGAPNDGGTGEAQILFGNGAGQFNSGDLTLTGMGAGDATGMSVAGVGDINGDGFADVVIGSPGTGTNNGSAYIIFGDNYTGSNSIDVTTLGDPIFVGDLALDGSAVTSVDIEISETFTGGTTGFILKSDGLIELYNLNDAAAPTLINSPLNDTDGSFNGSTTFDIEFLAGYSGGADPLTNAVDIVSKGDFLFILSDYSPTGGQVTVLNMTDPTSPLFESSYVGAELSDAVSMAINEFGQLVVVTNNAGTDGSFALLDVNFGGNIIGLSGSAIVDNAAFAGATDIVIGEDGYAYVATNSEIRIVDLTGANPTLGGTLTLSNTTSLYIDEFTNNLYAVTSAGDLAAYDISSTPGAPVIIDLDAGSTYSDPTNLSGATDLIVTDNTAFVSTANGVIVVILDGTSTATFGNIDTAAATTFDQNAVALATDEDGFIYTVSDDGSGTNYLVNFDLIPDGLKINGLSVNDYLGMDIASAGDVNSDGYSDFLISIPTAGGANVGEVHLVYGDEHLMDVTLGVNTFEINGIDVNTAGGDNQIVLTYMGDFNGGGASDFGIVEDDGTTTTLHLFYGESAGAAGTATGIASSDVKITEAAGDTILSGGFAGDFNADGFDDFVVVVDTGAGTIADIYVIYGSNSAVNLDTSQFDNTNSFYMSYDYGNDFDTIDPAFTITTAGDLNGDGFEDILIGLPEADNASVGNDSFEGSAVAIYGRDSGPNNVMTDDDGFGLLNARWAMNETTGTTVSDGVGASNLNYVGGASVNAVLGFLDGALSFNGSTQYATVNADPGLSTNFTLSAWVNRASLGAMTIASAAAAAAINDFNFGFNALNQLEISFENQVLATTTSFTTTSDWHHYSVAFDGANVFLYVDGNLEASAAFASPFTFDSNFNLATGSDQASDFLNGSIDDVRVYSDALDADKIDYLFNNLDGNTDFAVLDASQNNQTLVGTNTSDTMSDNGHDNIGFKGGGGDDSIYISNANFNFIDGGTGTLDTLYLQGPGQIYDLRSFGSEDIARLEVIDLLDTDQTLLLSDANLMNIMSTADGGGFTITNTGGNGILLFEGQGPGMGDFSKVIDNDDDFLKMTDTELVSPGVYDFGSAQLDVSSFVTNASLVLGSNFVLDTDANDLITAGSMGETLIADHDDDVLNDGFQNDISMFGFGGNDTFDINSGDFNMIDGGMGMDTLNFVVNDGSIDFSSFADYEINRIEAIQLVDSAGPGGQTMILTLENLFAFSLSSDTSQLDLQSASTLNKLIIDDQDGNNEALQFSNSSTLAQELDLADDGIDNDSIFDSAGSITFTSNSNSFSIDANLFASNVDVI